MIVNEPPHGKTNKMACAPSKHSDQPGHPPSQIRFFVVRRKKAWVLSYPLSAQRRLWSDWEDVQADLSLRWAHSHFVGFVIRWLKYCWDTNPVQTPEVDAQPTRHFTPWKYWLITQEAVAPYRHDWKIVDWDVKLQHKQSSTDCATETGL